MLQNIPGFPAWVSCRVGQQSQEPVINEAQRSRFQALVHLSDCEVRILCRKRFTPLHKKGAHVLDSARHVLS